MKSEKTFIYLFLLMISLGLPACYPTEKDITYEDFDIAVTGYDKDYYSPGNYNHFQEFQTFVMPDTVVHITEAGVVDNITRDFDRFILDQVKSNMLKMGYTEETDPATNRPDIAITVSVTTSEHIVYEWYPYWEWYWMSKKIAAGKGSPINDDNPWSPFYGWGNSTSYTAGSIIMEIVDNSRVDLTTKSIPVIWAGLINGATGAASENVKSRISTGIDRCFDQSPYLLK